MDTGDGNSEGAGASMPRSHRRPRAAVVRYPTNPRFWQTVRENSREPMGVALAVFAAILWGWETVASGTSFFRQAVGVLAAGLGVLLLASYVLHFHPAVLDDDRWSRTPSRRAVRGALKYTWGVAQVAVLLALAAWCLVWLAGLL